MMKYYYPNDKQCLQIFCNLLSESKAFAEHFLLLFYCNIKSCTSPHGKVEISQNFFAVWYSYNAVNHTKKWKNKN